MDHEIIHISTDAIFPIAERYFLKSAGFDGKSEKHKRMWSRAMEVYESIREKAEMKAVIRRLAPDKKDGADLYFAGVKIRCLGFERLSSENVKDAYFYVLTAGDIKTESPHLIDQLYSDIWGTSLVDAARNALEKTIESMKVKREEESILSPSYGPGYYGMALDETVKLFQLINPAFIQVSLSPGGMMLPQKSITGLYLTVKNGEELPPASCESCIGGSSGCSFCNYSTERKSSQEDPRC